MLGFRVIKLRILLLKKKRQKKPYIEGKGFSLLWVFGCQRGYWKGILEGKGGIRHGINAS